MQAEEFWSNASRDIDGMLGGFANLHVPDMRASKAFIKKLRAKDGLTEDGVIVFKDNLSAQQESEFDCEDYSWTRPESLVLDLFNRAGLRVVAENLQTGFPSGMYKVKMFALKPVTSKYVK
ncbi:hypothetical protein TELCIR_13033 [Teladorsagia circumcincta]|uniref:Alpha N-terminal protein methyltransferase 1 n=1 Tax=Teladorsagia circumcincta TaxID=45464 RepID=A0A2G9U549_TELCI|nr:hypothetical protein TELCIR_13033 [Teladorsagia circumcincta]